MSETLEQLTQNWIDAKQAEREANEERLSVEARILELCKDEIKQKGTTNLSTGLKIVTGFTEKWNQESVESLNMSWDYSTYPFPFKVEFKPVKSLMDALGDLNKKLFEVVQEAVTVSPSKPSFSFTEKK